MNIFKKRPLCLILCIMLAGFSLFLKLDPMIRLGIVGICSIIASAVIIFCFKDKRVLPFVCIFSFVASILLSVLFTYLNFPTQNEQVRIIGTVEDIKPGSYSTVLTVRTDKIDGRLAKHKLTVYTEDTTLSQAEVNYEIEFTADVTPYVEASGNPDENTYYVSQGYDGFCKNVSDSIIKGYSKHPLRSALHNMRSAINTRLEDVTDDTTGAFLSALLIGDRSRLDGSTELSFTRLGITHILALSGGHLVIFAAVINKLLTALYVNKRYRSVIIILFTVFYMMLTGMSATITRAGIMTITYYLLFLFKNPRDMYTSLSISIFLIILFDPCAAYDVSLWLSALATLGVVCYSELEPLLNITGKPRICRLLNSLINGTLSTLMAISATFAITMLCFDSFSVLSPFTTLPFSFLTQVLIYMGMIAALLPGISALGEITVVYSDFIRELCGRITADRDIMIRYDHWLIVASVSLYCILFFLFLVIEIKHKRSAIGVLCSIFAIIFLGGYGYNAIGTTPQGTLFAPLDNADVILLDEDDATTLIYMGNCTYDGYLELYGYLYDNKITYVDKLVITEYRYESASFLESLTSHVRTELVCLPVPDNLAELGICYEASHMLSDFTTDLHLYEDKEVISCGSYSMMLFNSTPLNYDSESSDVIVFGRNGQYCTYISSGMFKDDNGIDGLFSSGTQSVILGSNGPKYGKKFRFEYYFDKADYIYVCNGTLFSDELQSYYDKKGTSIIHIDAPTEISNVE